MLGLGLGFGVRCSGSGLAVGVRVTVLSEGIQCFLHNMLPELIF